MLYTLHKYLVILINDTYYLKKSYHKETLRSFVQIEPPLLILLFKTINLEKVPLQIR